MGELLSEPQLRELSQQLSSMIPKKDRCLDNNPLQYAPPPEVLYSNCEGKPLTCLKTPRTTFDQNHPYCRLRKTFVGTWRRRLERLVWIPGAQ